MAKRKVGGVSTVALPEGDWPLVAIDQLKPHPRNARQGDVGAIVESIKANGFYRPIVVQQSTGYILAGNHSWMAAREMGLKVVPVAWIDCDDDRALRILLADNRTNDLAAYDNAALANLLTELQEQTGTLLGTGFDADALDELLADMNGPIMDDGEGLDESGKIHEQFQVLVTCESEGQQVKLLERLNAEGYKCRALIS